MADLAGTGFEIVLPGRERGVKGGHLYDLVIVGGGPAGLTAAVYAARKNLDTALVSKDIGGQTLLTSDIENYMGYQYVTGRELAAKFEEQVKKYPIDVAVGEEVARVEPDGERFFPHHIHREDAPGTGGHRGHRQALPSPGSARGAGAGGPGSILLCGL